MNHSHRLALLAAAFFILHSALYISASAIGASASVAYAWDTVPIGGCGYVTGIVARPNGDIYIRSDMGGAMLWDRAGQKWIPLCDMFGSNLQPYYSVDAIALDPSNINTLYIAVAKTGNPETDILRSTDKGKSWSSTGWKRAYGGIFGGAHYRWAGERLAVDPHKNTILYYGTRENGLWKNTDPASTRGAWTQIPKTSVPPGSGKTPLRETTTKVGVTFVAFDPNGGTNAGGETNIIYAGSWGDGVYKSTDAGKTWNHMDGSPRYPIRGLVSPLNGTLYVTSQYDNYAKGSVAYCPRGGAFADSAGLPKDAGFSGLSLHPTDPNIVMVARQDTGQNSPIYRSTNGGRTFSEITKRIPDLKMEPLWWPMPGRSPRGAFTYFFSHTCGLLIDPIQPKRIWTINWYGTLVTDDIDAKPSVWKPAVAGHEGSNPRCLFSPTAGETVLFSGIGDSSGYRHTAPDHYPDRQLGGFSDMNSYDAYPGNPNIVYRVGMSRGSELGGFFRSTDNGKKWTFTDPAKTATLPDTTSGGRIAVSPLDPNRVVWLPHHSDKKPAQTRNQPYVTTDGGTTWAPCRGLEKLQTLKPIINNSYLPTRQPLTANRAGKGDYIYLVNCIGENATLYRSSDGGSNFTQVKNTGLPAVTTQNWIAKGAPNQDGGLWVSLGKSGLYQSTNHGDTFAKIPGVTSVTSFGFGKSGNDQPAAVYMIGKMEGDTQPEDRIYRSDDMGKTWVRINDDDHKFGLANSIEGDGQVYGRVYVGTSGRGIFYGTEDPKGQ